MSFKLVWYHCFCELFEINIKNSFIFKFSTKKSDNNVYEFRLYFVKLDVNKK